MHGADKIAEKTLGVRASRGDAAAFGVLVHRYMRRCYYAALGLVGSHEEALDLSQEAFARAFRARRTLDPERLFYPWLYQTLRRLCFNFLRDAALQRRKLREAGGWLSEETGESAAGFAAERAVELRELRNPLEAAIAELPHAQREVLVLKEFEGLRYREIADLLDVPIGTVMSRLYAARKSLAARLQEIG